MLRNIFRIPDTFDPDDRRRRQILNILLISTLILIIVGIVGTLLIFVDDITLMPYILKIGTENLFNDPYVGSILNSGIFFLISSIILLVANHSPKVPNWLTGVAFVTFFCVALTLSGTPENLAYGSDVIFWVLPISISAIVINPAFAFVVALGISTYIWVAIPHPNDIYPNIYVMLGLLFTALVTWLGMSIANRAIRDARREAANNKATLNSIADGVLVLNLQGNFLSANPALLRMIPEKDLQEIIARPLGKTLQWKRKVFSITASPVPEVGTVAVFRDETRRHETERARDALIATASHELRTPLAAIMNYLELLLMLVKLDKVNVEEFKEHLSRALENSQRLQNLVDNILDQAQIQAGMLELKNQSFNLRVLLEKTRQLLDILIKEKNLSYELSIAQDVPPEIVGDPDRLHQVLVNLIGNAIKFTKQGGIKVNVSAPQKEILSIEVADSGPGIPPEQLPDIFEAFRRGSNYAQRERQGAGLGLSIAKEIVTRMGGEISAVSEAGSGSTFTVAIPLQSA